MKLTIEIDDANLKRAIDQQVSKMIADLTEASIKERVDAILTTKFGRISESVVEAAVADAARKAVSAVVDQGYNGAVVRNALATAAERIIKGART